MPALTRLCSQVTLFSLVALSCRQTLGADAQAPASKPKDLDTPREFPTISSRQEWEAHAKDIREHVLVSCGLWPLPPRAPLDKHIFAKIDRGDYSIEKVYIQTYPGFYLAGNLYRPLHKGNGLFPAVLNPHGHWSNGRMADEKDGSIAARCISFARMGMIAFSYDMVGYNDTHFADPQSANPQYNVHRQFATNRTDLLWNISLMGLQTWNSIRALDFLQSLPDADPKRLACTGESGGGTQTFILGAVEDRLALQAPIVMVSHIMQGGCLCENAPGLRVQFSNMEIAAAPAPRPQMLVAATGDWTKDTLTVEGPSIAHIYELLGARENFHYTRFDFPHNYNQTTRQAVYGWFNHWLMHAPSFAPLKEQPYQKEPDADLRVFPNGKLPDGAMTRDEFIASLRRLHLEQLEQLAVHDKASLKEFKAIFRPAWRHTLQLEPSLAGRAERTGTEWQNSSQSPVSFSACTIHVIRNAQESPIVCTYWRPKEAGKSGVHRLALCSTSTETEQSASSQEPQGPTLELLRRGIGVLSVEHFSSSEPEDQFSNFYCTYNRTTLQNRVRDLVTLCSVAKSVDPNAGRDLKVALIGTGKAGLWSIMAAPAADLVVADCAAVDSRDEHALLSPELFCPGLLALGGFETAAVLAAPNPLALHNAGNKFGSARIREAFSQIKAGNKFKCEPACLSDEEIANWVAQ